MKIEQEKIDEWKSKYGRVFEYRASKDGESDKTVYFRPISPDMLDMYEAMLKKSPMAADDIIIDNCWLDGDPEFKTRDDYKMGLRDWLGYLLVKVEGIMAEL